MKASKEIKRSAVDQRACASCGLGNRHAAQYCATCGRALSGGFMPAGSLMASYHRWRNSTGPATIPFEPAARLIGRHDALTAFAFAFVTFSVVPFVGVLFCPAALLLGMFCLLRRVGQPLRVRSNRPMIALALAILVSTVQVALWWMLINVPGAGIG